MDVRCLRKPLNFENESELKNEYKKMVMYGRWAFYLPVLRVFDHP
jgi:hypothetical protein